ncbi:DNA primase [Tumebacillus sp. ITR2]|uniref:DNA primase n=1 Tax=Tumebacillus amylolyticus TaxID=2801339 RepID=A0ABS1JDG9_9BACL|nr:DNA primase [Tumebacillus amylolyticus]MBL0388337.1 DNA primase [Tumebacillus amylolyticus]
MTKLRRRIPEEIVERVRQHFDIVDVIGEYVGLKKAGRNSYTGLCPFHNEKSPSFHVSQDKQLYHCFGCSASGNLFTFLIEKEGITFQESVERLAQRANIALPAEEMEDVESPEYKRRKEMLRAHELAAKYYNHILMNTEHGKLGLRYLEERGISRTTIDAFQLGYAPDAWDVLRKFLLKRGFAEELLFEAGLLSEAQNVKGRYFDKFRHRVMYPIHDAQGNVIGFGGRILTKEKDSGPKYLNSPETPLFHKGRHLYNLHRARSNMRSEGRVLVLEGYMDVIASYQAGVQNVVAVLGTALTSDHVRLLQRNVQEIVMMFDGDAAGQKAALRSAEVVKDAEVKTRVATLPEGLDPDDFLKKYGKDAYVRAIQDNASSMTTFRVLAMRKDFNLSTDVGREDYLKAVIQTVLTEVTSPMELEKQLRELSEEFGVSVDALNEEVRLAKKSAPAGDKPDRKWNTNRNNADGVSVARFGKSSAPLPAHIVAERILLTHMLIDEGVARQVQDELADEFSVDEHLALAAHLYAYYAEHEQADPQKFLTGLEDRDLIKLTTQLLFKVDELDRRPEFVDEYIQRIRVFHLERELKRFDLASVECGNRGDWEGMLTARAEMERIKSSISALKNRNNS